MKTPIPWENLGPSDSPFRETPTMPAAGASVINQRSLLLNSQRSMLMISLLIAAIVLLNGATKFTETPVQRRKDPKQNIHLSPWSVFPSGLGLQYACLSGTHGGAWGGETWGRLFSKPPQELLSAPLHDCSCFDLVSSTSSPPCFCE